MGVSAWRKEASGKEAAGSYRSRMSRIETRLARMSASKAGPARDSSSFSVVEDWCRLETARDMASSDLRVAIQRQVSVTDGRRCKGCPKLTRLSELNIAAE